MPDITMCSNQGCPLFETCYRAQATPDRWQSYTSYEYEENGCENFIESRNVVKAKKARAKRAKPKS